MDTSQRILSVLERLEARLAELDQKVDNLSRSRAKWMEWVATLSEQIESLDTFREEVRATLEPLFGKLENVDEVVRIIQHATSDVSRRIEQLERAG